MLRGVLGGGMGAVIGWLIGGLWWIGAALAMAALACVWWWARRRAWHRAAILQILWGGMIADEFRRRHEGSASELGDAVVEKVYANVT